MLNVSVRPQPAAVAAVSALAATAGKTSSDEILVEQIAAGSKPAMQVLFARHRTYVYRWLLRFVSNETIAEDLLSEVFLDVWRQAGRFQRRSSVSTWLLAIARHKALSARRRRTQGAELDEKIEATIADPANNPELALQERIRANWCAEHCCDCRPSIVRSSTWSITTRSRSTKQRTFSTCHPRL
jgi:DNA-directed RNA polymerase specialized sigma24 family protein